MLVYVWQVYDVRSMYELKGTWAGIGMYEVRMCMPRCTRVGGWGGVGS